jgi:hypothetical protein
MVAAFSHPFPSSSVAVLLHPSTVPVIDVFRSLSRLEDQYDLAMLDGSEQALAAYTQPDVAKSIISDALLLAFALTRQRGRPFVYRPLGSRHGSMDEYCLLTMIGASRDPSSGVALEAARLLEIESLDFMAALAGEMVHQFDLGALAFEVPSLSDFRAMMDYKPPEEVLVGSDLNGAEFNFRHR